MGKFEQELLYKTDTIFEIIDLLQLQLEQNKLLAELSYMLQLEDPFVADENYIEEQNKLLLIFELNNVYDDNYQLDNIQSMHTPTLNQHSNGGPVNLFAGGGPNVNAYRAQYRRLPQRSGGQRRVTTYPFVPADGAFSHQYTLTFPPSGNRSSLRRRQGLSSGRHRNERRRQRYNVPNKPPVQPEQPVSTWVSPYWDHFLDRLAFKPTEKKPYKQKLIYDFNYDEIPVTVTSNKEYVMNLDLYGNAELNPQDYIDNLNKARQIINYGIEYLGSEGYRLRLRRTLPILRLEARNTYGINGIDVDVKPYSENQITKVTYIPLNKKDNPNIGGSYINNKGELFLTKPNYNTFGYVKVPETNTMMYYDPDLTVGHEFGHEAGYNIDIKPLWNLDNIVNGFNPFTNLFGEYGYSVLNPIFKRSNAYINFRNNVEDRQLFDNNIYDFYEKYRDNPPKGFHDALPWELYSDLWGLRLDLQKNGIFDSTLPNNIFTRDLLLQYKNLRFKDGILPRIFHNFSEDDIIWMINNVAQNNNSGNNNNINQYDLT